MWRWEVRDSVEMGGEGVRRAWGGGTYAAEVVTSCQPLVRFCLSSLREVMPSFLFISATCFSLAARTWDRVRISSSTWTHTHTLS